MKNILKKKPLLIPLFHAICCFAATNVTHHTHFSAYMGNRQWGYNIYLPAGYDTAQARYPVIYMLHGWGDDENRMVFMADTLHSAIRTGRVPPSIMVFPNGGQQTFWCDYSVWQYQQNINPDSYVTRELIPHIDSAFRTIPSRATRLLQGFSMGGWGAQHLTYKYLSLFGRVCALSPGGRNVDSLNNPYRLIFTNAEYIKANTKIRLVVGSIDGLKKESDSMVGILTRLAIPHEYQVVPNVAHSPEGIYAATGVKNLQFLTSGLASTATSAETGSGPKETGMHPGFIVSGPKRMLIVLRLAEAALVSVNIFSATGRLVRELEGKKYKAGRVSIPWDLKNSAGAPVPQALYVCVLNIGKFTRQSAVIPMGHNQNRSCQCRSSAE